MERPNDELEKEFNKGGIFFLKEKSIKEQEGKFLGVEVELAIPAGTKISCPDFSFSVLNRREVATLMTDWTLDETGEQRTLRFLAMIRIPDDSSTGSLRYYMPGNVAQTFLDLCFYAGNEALPEGREVDTYTKQRADTKLRDLGWVLPSRYVDTVIDALGKMNDAVLSGMLRESILYGVRVSG